MSTLITNGVKISVETMFLEGIEEPNLMQNMFGYKIKIVNHNEFPIKLLSRFWKIFDSCGSYSQVEGQGVVGEMPIIYPNQSYEYGSFCNLQSDMGSMEGYYQFRNLFTNKLFEVSIPKFVLITPDKLN